jgi:AcrR family transcriptional regulator
VNAAVTPTSAARPLRRDAAQNRERLLAAASQVFADQGLDAGVEEVARAAGVGMGTLYRRFPSKQALIDELVGGMRHELLLAAQQAAPATDGTGLENLLVRAGELQAAQPACLQRLWAESDAGLDEVAQFRALLAALLASAQEHGRIRSDIVASDVSLVLLSISNLIESSGQVAPNAWRRHVEVMLAGLRPPDPRFLPALTEPAVSAEQWQQIIMSRRR